MTLRFGLVGCGAIGLRHADLAGRYGRLTAVCDIDQSRASQFADQFGAASFDSLENLLHHEAPDVVIICTPNGLHSAQSILALEAGCHVICEKPMAISSLDAVAMVNAARKSQKKLFVVKQNRFNPPVKVLRDLIINNKLGHISNFHLSCFWNRPDQYYKSSWRGTRQLDGGILYTQFSHFVDLLIWMLGPIDVLSGARSNYLHPQIEFEDAGVALLRTESGALGTMNYSINSYQRNVEGSFLVLGERGTVKVGGQYLNELEIFAVEDCIQPALPTRPANEYGYYQGSMSNHHQVYESVVSSLRNSGNSLEGQEALKTIELIEKIYAASPLIRREPLIHEKNLPGRYQ